MIALLTLGFLIGVTHAFEADHLAAVSALVSGKSKRATILRHGAFWGVGHTITLTLIGGVVLLAGVGISPQASNGLEFIVGLMLLALGAHVLYRLRRDRAHFHRHSHGDTKGQGVAEHFHLHSHSNETTAHDRASHRHQHPDRAAFRSLAVGIMHGAAGSAALVLAAAAAMTSPLARLLYILLFGIGSIIGMVAMSMVIALPLVWSARHLTRLNSSLQLVVGLVTMAVGAYTVFETVGLLIA